MGSTPHALHAPQYGHAFHASAVESSLNELRSDVTRLVSRISDIYMILGSPQPPLQTQGGTSHFAPFEPPKAMPTGGNSSRVTPPEPARAMAFEIRVPRSQVSTNECVTALSVPMLNVDHFLHRKITFEIVLTD